MNINEIVKSLSNEEATRGKNVLAGTSSFVNEDMIKYSVENGFYRVKSQKFIPSLFTVINEALVNCSDHAISCINRKTIQHKMNPYVESRYVDNILVQLDSSSGKILVKNDGYGIPIIMKDGVYLPIELFVKYNTGTNTEQDPYRITGGTNGCGAKIITTFSTLTTIRCQDDKNNFYVQITSDSKGNKKVGTPIINPKTDDTQYTSVTFTIDWADSLYKKYSKETHKLFYEWLTTRCASLSLFLNQYRTCTVKLNNREFRLTYADIPKDAIHTMIIPMKIKDKTKLGYNDQSFGSCNIYLSVLNSGVALQLSFINGIQVTSNPILDRILALLFKSIKSEVASVTKFELTRAIFNKYTLAMFVGTIMNPQWVGQTKHSITISNDIFDMYQIDYQGVTKELAAVFIEHLIGKQSDKIVKNPRKKINNDKYTEALNISDRKRKAINYLWLAEGDSALEFIKNGLGTCSKMVNPEFDYNNSGRLSLGGVIINTFHRIQLHDMTKFKYVKNRNKSVLIMDEKCTNNKFIETFINACNIRMDCSYSTEEELNTLSYKYIIIATDQDKDGWNINGLLLVFLMKWPSLVASGRVLRLQTPVARIKPQKIKGNNYKDSVEFFSETEVEEYLKIHNIPKGSEVKYYKGLASHEPEFRDDIFRNIRKYLYTFQVTPKSVELLEIYYNKLNPDMRKTELRTPLRSMYAIEKKYYREHKIYISTFLQIYVKDYQLDNLNRKLLKVFDGQNNVCGKLLHVAPAIYRKFNETRVSYLGSEVAKRTNYHHGENSMYETIFKSSQTFSGKKMYPIYCILGEFGSRTDGGKKHGAPRYTYITINQRFHSAMFRAEDNILLEHCKSEAEIIEPKYYFPIMPLAIMENYKTTAHGWKIEIWGRDLSSIIKAMNELLNGRTPVGELPISLRTTKAEFVHATDGEKDYLYSKGKYTIQECKFEDRLIVSELPLGVWNTTYLKELYENKDFVEKLALPDGTPKDNTTNDTLSIIIPLRKGWRENIKKREDPLFSDIELAFNLRVRICDELNFIAPDGSVISFDRYIDFLIYWFNLRKEFYLLRIKRQVQILKNKIEFYQSKYRYLKNFHAWGLGNRVTTRTAHEIISQNGLIPLNASLVEPDIFVPTDKITKFVRITQAGQDEDFDELFRQKLITKYASFDYLDCIVNSKVRDDHMTPLEKKINEFEEKLELLSRPNAWKKIWAEEIKNLVSILREDGLHK